MAGSEEETIEEKEIFEFLVTGSISRNCEIITR
jgi:hypothetical protein